MTGSSRVRGEEAGYFANKDCVEYIGWLYMTTQYLGYYISKNSNCVKSLLTSIFFNLQLLKDRKDKVVADKF
jgi:hypothetical protein